MKHELGGRPWWAGRRVAAIAHPRLPSPPPPLLLLLLLLLYRYFGATGYIYSNYSQQLQQWAQPIGAFEQFSLPPLPSARSAITPARCSISFDVMTETVAGVVKISPDILPTALDRLATTVFESASPCPAPSTVIV